MAVLVGTWWYWVIKGQYWAVLGFILESLIVVRFVDFCWNSSIVVRFVVFVGSFIVVKFVVLCWCRSLL